MNYELDIHIDCEALDIECLDQAKLMLRYTRIEAEAKREEDRTKETLDLTKAELDKSIRTVPENYKIEKVTEAAITSIILMDEKYQRANALYIDAKFESKVASGAVRAFEQRKDMLETLVRLHGQQYFAGPKVPRDLSYEAQKAKKQKEVSRGIGEAMRTRKKE